MRAPREGWGEQKKIDELEAACVPVGTKRLPVATVAPPTPPPPPRCWKIGALNEGEAILMENLPACFLKWLCWHENQTPVSDVTQLIGINCHYIWFQHRYIIFKCFESRNKLKRHSSL